VRTRTASLAALLVAAFLAGCAGRPCGDLSALRTERDAARAAYTRLVEPGTASPEVTEQADTDLHALERRVYDLEQSCKGR